MFGIDRGFRTVAGETVAGVALAVTVFCVVLGSSSVPELVGPGRKLRWAALFALALIGAILAVRSPRSPVSIPFRIVAGIALWLSVLGVISTAWSVDPRLTFGRACSFAVLAVTGVALGLAARDRPLLPRRLLDGMLAGTVAAALAGAVLLLVSYDEAVQPATEVYPVRYRGLGENPDTVSMLEGLTVPIAFWLVVRARTRAARVAAGVSAVLLLASISAAGSRGGLIAAFVGSIVLALVLDLPAVRRLSLAAAVVVSLGVATAATQIPKPVAPSAVDGGTAVLPSLPVGAPIGPTEARYGGLLADELFRTQAGPRSLLTSSGRLQAWWEATKQARQRPLLGYGFGTEEKVFVDRVYNFNGGHVENSFVGMSLQLGGVGLASLLALVAAVAWAAVLGLRGRRAQPARHVAAPLAGLIAGGIMLMGVQSFAYSVGNVATVSFWTAGFLAAACASRGARSASAQVEGGVAVSP